MKDYTVKDVLIYVRNDILQTEPILYSDVEYSRCTPYLCNAIHHKRCVYKFGIVLCKKTEMYLDEQKPNKDTGMNSSFALHEFWIGSYSWWRYSKANFKEAMKEKRKFLNHIINKLK